MKMIEKLPDKRYTILLIFLSILGTRSQRRARISAKDFLKRTDTRDQLLRKYSTIPGSVSSRISIILEARLKARTSSKPTLLLNQILLRLRKKLISTHILSD
jgi:hypothetical protein